MPTTPGKKEKIKSDLKRSREEQTKKDDQTVQNQKTPPICPANYPPPHHQASFVAEAELPIVDPFRREKKRREIGPILQRRGAEQEVAQPSLSPSQPGHHLLFVSKGWTQTLSRQ